MLVEYFCQKYLSNNRKIHIDKETYFYTDPMSILFVCFKHINIYTIIHMEVIYANIVKLRRLTSKEWKCK